MIFFLLTIDLRSSFAQRWWSNIERTPIHLFFFKNLYLKSLHLLTFVCISLLHPIKTITMVIDSTRWVLQLLSCPKQSFMKLNYSAFDKSTYLNVLPAPVSFGTSPNRSKNNVSFVNAVLIIENL